MAVRIRAVVPTFPVIESVHLRISRKGSFTHVLNGAFNKGQAGGVASPRDQHLGS